MIIHREGYKTIAWSAILYCVINIISFYYLSFPAPLLCYILLICSTLLFLFVISFFRIPRRSLTIREDAVIAPADGKVVTIEEVQADEYFSGKRIQVSIFMSPLNVHVNRNPVSGEVVYAQYHKGKYLVAWHPKSSFENERHSVVYRKNGREILVKQIAGLLANRISNYLQRGQQVRQGEEMGFIRFGSRVDVLLPADAAVTVKIGEKTKGGVTVIARW